MDWANVTALIGILLGSNWLGNLLIEVYKNKKRKKTPAELMLLAIGRDRLMFLSKKHIRNGGIPEDEYESFTALGDAYLAMKGNSKVKALYEQAKKLPMIIEEGGD